MNRPSRRSFLGGSALTLAALTGTLDPDRHLRTSASAGVADLADEYDLPSALADALEAIPAESAVEMSYRLVVAEDVSAIDEVEDLPHQARVAGRELGVEAADLEMVATAIAHDYRRRLTVAVGSMDREEDGETIETAEGWRLADDGETTVASVEGRTAFVAGEGAEERHADARAVAGAARGEVDRLVEADDHAGAAFERLVGFSTVLFVPDAADSGFRTPATGILEAFAGGFEVHPANLEDRSEAEYVLFTDGNEPNEETIRSLIEEVGAGIVRETAIDRESSDGDLVHVRAVLEAPPEYDREAAPEVRVQSSLDRDEGTLAIEHVGGEAVEGESLSELELWVDGELVDAQPGDRVETFEPGDAMDVAVDPLSRVILRWFDEDGNRQYVYVNEAIDEEAFEFAYDLEEGALEVTYVGERDADPDRVELVHRGSDGVRLPDGFEGSTPITTGETATVEDVAVDDVVTVDIDVPEVPGVSERPLRRFHVTPPRLHLHRREGSVAAVYHDERDRPAAEFRTLVDGEPADVQLEDRTETLSEGDAIDLGEIPIGSTVVVEWLKPEEPVTVDEHHVTPEAFVDVEYDAESGTVRVEHRDGDVMDAENVELRIDEELAETQPSDEHDEFGPGDVVTAEAPPFATVEAVWVGEEAERGLGGTTTARNAIEATYDPGTGEMELTYVGEQPADPAGLEVSIDGSSGSRTVVETGTSASGGSSGGTESSSGEENGDGGGQSGDGSGDGGSGGDANESEGDEPAEPPSFAEEYEELTEGDSIVLEAEIGDRVRVSVRHETANTVSVRSIGHFPTRPRHAFTFRRGSEGPIPGVNRPGDGAESSSDPTPNSRNPDELYAVYVGRVDRDASEFRLLVDDEPAEDQPADEHDMLEGGDAIPVGKPEVGTTLRAEWTVPDEPVEVGAETIAPEASFEVERDGDDGGLVVRHAGGHPIDAERLSVHVPGHTEGPIPWNGEGTVREGDSTTIDAEDSPGEVIVLFDEREVLDHATIE
jgi:hypothetical protein